MRTCFSLIVLSIFLLSCDPNRVYEENQDIEDAVWQEDFSPKFRFEIIDPQNKYNLYLNLRNGIAYPYHNVYIKYNLKDSTEAILSSELKEFFLFDPKTGKPFGDGLGDLFDHQFPLLKAHSFPSGGSYSIDIEQFMRLQQLPMIVSVGLRVEKSEE